MENQDSKPVTPQPQIPQTANDPTVVNRKPPSHQKVIQPSESFIRETSQNRLVGQTPLNAAPQANTVFVSPSESVSVTTPENHSSMVGSNSSEQNESLIGLTGSQVSKTLDKADSIPIGVYIIAAGQFVGFVFSFLYASNTILTVLSVLDLVFCFGLLLRNNSIRKIFIWMIAISMTLSALTVAGLFYLLEKANHNYNYAQNGVSTAVTNASNNPNITPSQLNQIQQTARNVQTTLLNDKIKASKAVKRADTLEALSILEGAVIIFYLTRPGVRERFQQKPRT